MAKFEGQERRMPGINACLKEYGMNTLEDARDLTLEHGINVEEIVKGVQPIAFDNAVWAYTLGTALALKKGAKSAAEASEMIGVGLQAFCVPGSVAEQRQVGLGHGNLGAMLLRDETKCFCFLAGHESFAAAEGAIGIARNANKARKEPLRVILNGLGKDAAYIISRVNGFTYVETDFDFATGEVKVVREVVFGEGERAKISYDFSYGIQQLERKVDLLDANQFRDLYIASRNDSYRRKATAAGIAWSPNDDNTIRSAKGFSLADVGIHPMFYDFTTRTPVEQQYNTDWQDEVFGNAGMMRHNISVTGGSKAIRYMASVGYMDQDGIIAPSNHNRINARLNLDAQITKHFSASLSYSMYDVKNKVVQAEGRMINDGVIQSMLMYLPNLPAYEENGDYARSAMIRMKTDWGLNFPENPLVIANELDISEKTSRHNLNFNLVYEPLPDLKISARLGQQWGEGQYAS